MLYLKVLIKGKEVFPWLRNLILFNRYSCSSFTQKPKLAYVPCWLKKYLGNLWDKHFLALGIINSADLIGIAVPYEEWCVLHLWERKRWITHENQRNRN